MLARFLAHRRVSPEIYRERDHKGHRDNYANAAHCGVLFDFRSPAAFRRVAVDRLFPVVCELSQ